MTLDNFLKKIGKDITVIGDSLVELSIAKYKPIKLVYGDDFVFNTTTRKFELVNPTKITLEFDETDSDKYIENAIGSLIEKKYWFTDIFSGCDLPDTYTGLFYSVKNIRITTERVLINTTAVIGNTFIDAWQKYFEEDLTPLKQFLWNQFKVNGDVFIHGDVTSNLFEVTEEQIATYTEPKKKKNKKKKDN